MPATRLQPRSSGSTTAGCRAARSVYRPATAATYAATRRSPARRAALVRRHGVLALDDELADARLARLLLVQVRRDRARRARVRERVAAAAPRDAEEHRLARARAPGRPGVVPSSRARVVGGVAASVPPQPATASAARSDDQCHGESRTPHRRHDTVDRRSAQRPRGRYDWRDGRGRRSVTDAVTVALAALGIVGQIAAVALLVAALLAAFGVGGPLRFARDLMWGNELWLTFVVAAVATLGSLFFSDIADFSPASCAGSSASSCTRSRSSCHSWHSHTTAGRPATCCRSRSSASPSRSTTC